MSGTSRSLAVIGGYRIPSLGYRILAGGLRLVPLLVLLVGLPDAILAYLTSWGVALPVSEITVTVAGVVIAVLSTATYIARPTGAYGPLGMATSGVVAVYLLVLWEGASYHLTIPNSSVVLTIGYADLILLFLIAPAIGIVVGLVTTVEDLRHPGERLPFDFPA